MARLVAAGAELERAARGERIERHHHEGAYAALVLRGGYVEAGDRGRVRAEAASVLFHDAFEGHFDSIGASGADILNLPLLAVPDYAVGTCADPDAVARLALEDPAAAARLLIETTTPVAPAAADWPDLLAAELPQTPLLRLDRWAADHGLTSYAVSRGFALAYGVSPKRYRLEQRAAAAARAICGGAMLSDAAFAAGFADQPHMTRAVSALFGRPPQQLRS
jgi:AraC-like DNA-binding protein